MNVGVLVYHLLWFHHFFRGGASRSRTLSFIVMLVSYSENVIHSFRSAAEHADDLPVKARRESAAVSFQADNAAKNGLR